MSGVIKQKSNNHLVSIDDSGDAGFKLGKGLVVRKHIEDEWNFR